MRMEKAVKIEGCVVNLVERLNEVDYEITEWLCVVSEISVV